MKVLIDTNASHIVIEDEFCSSDCEKSNQHNQELVKLAYDYVVQNELMLQCEDGKISKVK